MCARHAGSPPVAHWEEEETMEGRTRLGSASVEGKNIARLFALLLGVGYLAGGVIGFAATGFTGVVSDGEASLLGLDLNIFHNVIHLSIGAGLIVASRLRDVTVTQGILIGVGLFYLLAAVLGFINYLQIISIDGNAPNFALDNFLHLFSGGAALVFGLIGVRQQHREPEGRRPGTTAREPLPIEERRAAWNPDDTYREEAY